MDKKEGKGDASMEHVVSPDTSATTVDPTSATQGNDGNKGRDNSYKAKIPPAMAEIVDMVDDTPTQSPPPAAPTEVKTINVTKKTNDIAASASSESAGPFSLLMSKLLGYDVSTADWESLHL